MSLMRRAVSILIIALFWLAPLSLLLPGTDEANLPICCRRHGAHHCSMPSEAAQRIGTTPSFAAPDHCPRYPASATAANTVFALVLPVSAETHARAMFHISVHTAQYPGQPRSHSGRGPPASC